MAIIDIQYHALLEDILKYGYSYEDPNRKDVYRLEIPSHTFRHEFRFGFPSITTKKLFYNQVVTELLWFLRGDTNIKYLIDNNCNIWNKDAYNYYLKQDRLLRNEEFNEPLFKDVDKFIKFIKYEDIDTLKSWFSTDYCLGDLGPVYGQQWRELYDKNTGDLFRHDQIKYLINNLKNNPLSTEHIVNAWNPLDIDDMALPPCHYGFQVVVRPLDLYERIDYSGYDSNEKPSHFELDEEEVIKYGFELHWNQRSVDTFLGLPYNIASYATLALIIEQITGYKALAIQGDLKKVHLYDNSLDAVKEQLSRDVNKYGNSVRLNIDENGLHFLEYFNKPKLSNKLNNNLDLLLCKLNPNMFKLEHYDSYPFIKVPMLERNE